MGWLGLLGGEKGVDLDGVRDRRAVRREREVGGDGGGWTRGGEK